MMKHLAYAVTRATPGQGTVESKGPRALPPFTAPASLVRGDVSPLLTCAPPSHPHASPALVRDIKRDEADQAELVEQCRDGAVKCGKARPRGSFQAVQQVPRLRDQKLLHLTLQVGRGEGGSVAERGRDQVPECRCLDSAPQLPEGWRTACLPSWSKP